MNAVRKVGLLIGGGGLLMLVGGQLHPREPQATVAETLAGYFRSPLWDASHLLLLVGLWVAAAALVVARRHDVFDVRLRRQLAVTAVAWTLTSLELVPHLLARHDLHALEHGGPTPILDLHLLLGVVATPLFGLTAVLLAVALARTERTWPARLLAVPGVVGGLAYAASSPLIALTDDVAFAPLFAGQGLVSLFLVGTGIRLLARRKPTAARSAERLPETAAA